MAFDPIAYKNSVTEERNRSTQGWHRWSLAINSWLDHATQAMLDQAKINSGNRVIDIAAGERRTVGRRSQASWYHRWSIGNRYCS
jgi:hypothetical protein